MRLSAPDGRHGLHDERCPGELRCQRGLHPTPLNRSTIAIGPPPNGIFLYGGSMNTHVEQLARKGFEAYNTQGPNPGLAHDGRPVPGWDDRRSAIRSTGSGAPPPRPSPKTSSTICSSSCAQAQGSRTSRSRSGCGTPPPRCRSVLRSPIQGTRAELTQTGVQDSNLGHRALGPQG